MDKARLEKLSKIMNVVKKDFVSSTDVKSFLYSIITFAKENKQELENLSKEYLQTINEAIEDIENQNKTLLENVSNKTAQNQTDFESQVKELKEILKKVKAIKTTKPADGIDGVNPNPEDVVPLVLEKLPKQEEITGEKIVDKINALSLDDENKIDAKHIKNLPEAKGGKFFSASGIKEIIAGDNITVDNSNLGYPVINATSTNKGGVVFNFYRSTGLLEEDGFKAVVPYSGTITGWSISTKDGTPQTITLNIKKAPFDDINNFTAIDGSEPIILSSAINNSDTSLSTWTTTVNAGDHIEVTVESVSGTVRGVYGIINITKTS